MYHSELTTKFCVYKVNTLHACTAHWLILWWLVSYKEIHFNLQVIMIKEVPGPAISDTAVYTGQWLYIYTGETSLTLLYITMTDRSVAPRKKFP